jgi:hypothetical protein
MPTYYFLVVVVVVVGRGGREESYWQSLAFLSLWIYYSDFCPCPLCPSPLYVLSKFPSYKDICHAKHTLIQYDLILTNHICKDPIFK